MKGLSVDKSNSNETSVTCLTDHLTSFAVLVSIKDADDRPVRVDRYITELLIILPTYYTLAIHTS